MNGLFVADATAMAALGARLYDAVGRVRTAGSGDRAIVIDLSGDLGAGKTTLARGYLRAMGIRGAVRSPTYTLVEPYEVDGETVWHLDLYRVADPDELEYLGLRDMMAPGCVLLVEWPERGRAFLPVATLALSIDHDGDGRRVSIWAGNPTGVAILVALSEAGFA